MNSRRQPKPAPRRYDFEEVRPGSFVIGNPQIRGLLKGEGEISGAFFRLRSWRGEGLIARIRERGFSVSTLAERLEALPQLPIPRPLGKTLLREISGERGNYSLFDTDALHWRQLTPERQGEAEVIALREGAVVRHRRGRGSATFHQAVDERGRAGLLTLDETQALLQGYAQATASALRPFVVRRQPEGYLLPRPAQLPPPHRELLAQLGATTPDGLMVDEQGWRLAHTIYQLLRLQPTIQKEKQ